MPTSRGPSDPSVRTFEAVVESVDGQDVVLEETYFYPEGGGQPADRGTIDGVDITHVKKADSTVVHTLSETPDFGVGETVVGDIDDAFRTYTMRAHSASHVLYGAGRRVFEDIGYGGFDIGERKVRVDFETSTDVDDDRLLELERLTNRTVWDSRSVTWEELPREEALELDGIAFNTATEEGVMADADTVRVVTIEDWDVAACGGTHVSNTRTIGPVTVLERSNPGEGLTRIEFAVGPTAVEKQTEIHRSARRAGEQLGTSLEELPQEVRRVSEERRRLEGELTSLRTAALANELDGLELAGNWAVGAIGEYDPNRVGEHLQERVGEQAPVLAVVGDGDRPFVVTATDGSVDAQAIVEAVIEEFGGGGGGSSSLAQGGGLGESTDTIVEFLRERAETGI